ncbi:MAG: GH3 auxin-responsive promoter family protein [Pelagibacterales bacterium]|nr:GH3 auxin-responsive promoter family protein [Pelagibacterales bacterium]
MTIKEALAKILAQLYVWRIRKWAKAPLKTQKKVLKKLIFKAKHTSFGKDHHFEKIKSYKDFTSKTQIKDYEGLRPYVERVVRGEKNVLWPGKPVYFAKTSGTTSGMKYIPISKESMPTHTKGSRDAIFHYINETGKTAFLNKKVIFLQGSPVLDEVSGIKTGRLSGIIAHVTPKYLRNNIMPSWETNCIEDWEAKVSEITKETTKEDMAVIGGIPPWVQMYFEALKKASNKETVSEIFPNFNLFIYGGVNFEPYRKTFHELIGKKIDSIEYYPASEGFFAYQDSQKSKGLLLQLNSGIYYEFIELEDMKNPSPIRHNVGSVQIGVNYVLVISSSAGLWAYNTGDTVAFVSLSPHKIIVTGRHKHFISAFGEHVIGSEVEGALKEAIKSTKFSVNEFTVAPKTNPKEGLPYHEWWIEFAIAPKKKEMKNFVQKLDQNVRMRNTYYKDLIDGKVLKELKIVIVKKGIFKKYMKKIGKLGGQNKLPRLSNDRKIVEEIKNQNN